MAPIRTAVAGLGRMGLNYHCAKIAERPDQFQLTAGYDPIPARREAAAANYPNIQLFDDWRTFLKSDAYDLVIIATPSIMHGPEAVSALEAGKHVVTEKPMCMNVAEADAMIEAAQAHGKILTVHQNRRWDKDFLTVRKAVEEGYIGKLYSFKRIAIRYATPDADWGTADYRPQWRAEKSSGGGVLYDWGAHFLDQMLQLIKSRPMEVYGHMDALENTIDAEDWFATMIRFENGALGQVEVSMASRVPLQTIQVYGSKGGIVGNHVRTLENGEEHEFDLPTPEGSSAEFFTNLYEAITAGAPLIVKPEEVRQVMVLMDAIRLSNETRQVVLI